MTLSIKSAEQPKSGIPSQQSPPKNQARDLFEQSRIRHTITEFAGNGPEDMGILRSINRKMRDTIDNFSGDTWARLIARNPDILHQAVALRDIPTIHALIENQVNVNAQDAQGKTALHFADDPQIYKILVEEGKANQKIRDNQGWTALDSIDKIKSGKTALRWIPTITTIPTAFLAAFQIASDLTPPNPQALRRGFAAPATAPLEIGTLAITYLSITAFIFIAGTFIQRYSEKRSRTQQKYHLKQPTVLT